DAVALADGAHEEIVGDDGSRVLELAAQIALDGEARQGRRVPRVYPAVEDVRRHDAVGQPFLDERAVRLELQLEVRRVRHVHEAEVRVLEARAVAGEMLERGQDTRLVHAEDEGARTGTD